MTTRELKSVCLDFRRGILGRRSPENMCAVVSYPLSGYLCFLGVPNKVVEGSRVHIWIELDDGRIIDATADQFNGRWLKFPKVYIGELTEWHKKHCV